MTTPSEPSIPGPVLVRPKVTLEAMRWLPGDPGAVGACIGWLMACGKDFECTAGTGETTLLRVGRSVAMPGDWIIKGLKAFMVCDPETFAENYEPASEARP